MSVSSYSRCNDYSWSYLTPLTSSQLHAIAEGLQTLARRGCNGHRPLSELLGELIAEAESRGLDALASGGRQKLGRLAAVRPLEIAAAINRLRSLDIA